MQEKLLSILTPLIFNFTSKRKIKQTEFLSTLKRPRKMKRLMCTEL